MKTRNFFDFARTEPTQDGFLAWLISYANPDSQSEDEPLHKTATFLLDRLFEVAGRPKQSRYRSVLVKQGYKDIDLLVEVNNGEAVILIEDKVDSEDKQAKLESYITKLASEYDKSRIIPIYLKTGDQGDYQYVRDAGYRPFKRGDVLEVFERGEQLGVKSPYFTDFHAHLRGIDEEVRSYRHVPPAEWGENPRLWSGFFTALQKSFEDGIWKRYPQTSRFIVCFWWHTKGDKYLSLDGERLRFRIGFTAEDRSKYESWRRRKWEAWQKAVLSENGNSILNLKEHSFSERNAKPAERMTVASLNESYLQAGVEGYLDFEGTVQVLKLAESLMDDALKTAP